MIFDQPVFKILSLNDTGAAVGHQGGMVIPKGLEDYMPSLSGVVNALSPTIDQQIEAELFLNGEYVGTVATRYQYQTWGGARSPERRLTGNLGAIRNYAAENDILLIERSLDDLLHYRLSVETKSSTIYKQLLALANGRRWGVVETGVPPAGNRAIERTLADIEHAEDDLPTLISDDRATIISMVERKVRDVAFRRRLVDIYNSRCAVSGISIQKPSGGTGLDAAHIIPVEAGGTDDPRNGLLLSKDVHWAFDNGLVHIGADRRVVVPELVRAVPSNDFLRTLNGLSLTNPSPTSLRAADEALEWHRNAAMEKLEAGAH